MGSPLALLLALLSANSAQSTRLSCTMAAAKDRPILVAVGQTKVAFDLETFNAVFTSRAVLWTKPLARGDGYYLFTLDRSYRRLTIMPMRDRRTPLAKMQVGSCRKLLQ